MKHFARAFLFSATLTVVVATGLASPSHAQDAAKADGDAAAPGPAFSDSGPDAADYGAAAGYQPPGTVASAARPEHLVATYSRFDALVPARPVPRAATAWPF